MRVFLSYSSQDHLDADALRRALLGHRPDLDIYFAPHRNEVGAYWIARLDQELAAADAVVLMLGERVGPWQELEYFDALRRNRQHGRPLLAPVLLAETAPGLPFLSQFHSLDARGQGLADLVAQIVAVFDGLEAREPAPEWRLQNPYRGLLAMETQDAAYFFGRELLTTRILGAMAVTQNRVHMLVGNSGVGKSSVAQAGILGALRSQLWPAGQSQPWPVALADSRAWPVVRLAPGPRPLLALARAFVGLWRESAAEIEEEAQRWQGLLAGEGALDALLDAALSRVAFRMDAEPPRRVVLYVDQGEELYSRAEPQQAARFSQLLAEAADHPGVLAMMSLRADYYGRLQNDAALYPAARTIDVPPLDRSGIERVVRLPAERLGARFESGEGVEQIIAAAVRQPGALPMLSDLLADAWRSMQQDPRGDGVLRLPPGFVDIRQPLVDKAEQFVAQNPGCLALLQRLCTLKLALLPREGEIMRRRARRGECSDDEWQLLEAMAQRPWRLVTLGEEAGEASAEVAHEALLRHWPRVVQWLDDAREFLVWKSRFDADYRSWEDAGEQVRERTLLTGLPLEVAQRWLKARPADLGPGEQLFIEDSQRAADALEAQGREAERRLARQRRWTFGLVLAALVAVAAIAIQAIEARHQAELATREVLVASEQARSERAEALAQADLADARRLALAAGAMLDDTLGQSTLATLLAAESVRLRPTLEGRGVLRRALQWLPSPGVSIDAPWSFAGVLQAAQGPDMVFYRHFDDGAGEARSEVAIRHADGREVRPALDGAQSSLLLSADGSRLATRARGEGGASVWDSDSGERLFALSGENGELAFADDGRRLLVRRGVRGLALLGADDGRELAMIGAPAGVLRARLGADGRSLVSFGEDRRFRAWDALSGRSLWTSRAVRPEAASVTLSGDGLSFADLAGDGSRLEIGDTASGEARLALPIEGVVGLLRLSHDGGRLALILRTPGGEEEFQLWDAAAGTLLHRRPVHHLMRQLDFLPGAEALMLAVGRSRRDEPEGFVELIDADQGRGLWRLPSKSGLPLAAPIGDKLLVVPEDKGGRVLSPAGELPFELGEGGRLRSGLALAGAPWLALARIGADGDLIELRSRETGELQRRIEAPGRVVALGSDPAGRVLVAGLQGPGGERVVAWQVSDGARLGSFAVTGALSALMALDGGTRVAVLNRQGQLTTRRLSDAAVEAEFAHLAAADRWAAAARAPRLASWMPGILQWWDAGDGRLLASRPFGQDLRELALSPDGLAVAFVAGADDEGQLFLWQPGSEQPPTSIRLRHAHDLAFDAEGRQLLVMLGQDEARLVDVAGLRVVASLRALAGGRFVAGRLHPDGHRLVIEEQQQGRRALRVFARDSGQELARVDLTGPWRPLRDDGAIAVMDPQGAWQRLALETATADEPLLSTTAGALRRPAGTRRLLAQLPADRIAALPEAVRGHVTALGPPREGDEVSVWTVDPGGMRLAVVAPDGIAVVDAADGRRVALWPGAALAGAGIAVGPQLRAVRGLQFIDQGNGLLAFDTEAFGREEQRSRLWLWRWVDGPPRQLGDGNPINQVSASADGAWLASAEGAIRRDDALDRWVPVGRHQLRLWDGRSGALLRSLPFEAPVDSVAFSPSGGWLAARTAGEVALYAAPDWSERARFPIEGALHLGGSVRFAGERRVLAEAEGGIWSWDLDGGPARLLATEPGWPRIETSADGRLVLAAGKAGIAGLWAAADGERLLEPLRWPNGLADAFLPGPGDTLWRVDGEGLDRLRWRGDELLDEACRRVGHGLDDAAWRRYLGTRPRPGACEPG